MEDSAVTLYRIKNPEANEAKFITVNYVHHPKDSKGNGGGLNCGSLNKATEHQNEIIH